MENRVNYKDFNESMAKFQGNYEPPKKDKKVDFTTNKGQRIKYDYSDLESVQKAIRLTASKYGLSWNTLFESEKIKIENYGKEIPALLITPIVVINHSSGVEKSFKGIPLFATSLDPQSIGSVKTYAERYALSGAFGIASDEDDDGQIAKNSSSNQENDKEKTSNENNAENEFYKNKAEFQKRLTAVANKTGKKYKELEDYVISESNKNLKKDYKNVNSQNISKAIGYVKVLENAANKKAEANEQQSMMQGNTTNPVDWGK
ncbi:hypothetical protein FEZ48_06335 [Marinilactibacillus psychrotolerans]|uniref:Single-stranded DNA-binding protein n=1 Tax=Marinilactibacillus psychrotolerans TaxID=191770 RepID=A0A5R9C418_9LACT|nr:ERF family protein [Marinilactibacillus psychrotolerans]TLQ07595.1 hypothetical protein FEZ48_06335 [Marinilactibacillus psychrotolerans]